jgi:hypothetical protein
VIFAVFVGMVLAAVLVIIIMIAVARGPILYVALAVPFDPVVYDSRTAKKEGITVVAPSQIAVDLLGMPGRGPNEAEALIEWMRDIEYAGRA